MKEDVQLSIVQPLKTIVAGINARELSNVLGQPFEEGVPVLEGAALELPTRGGGTAKGEREGKRETECGADVRQRDGQGGADPQDERSLRIERSLDLSIDIVPDWCVVRGVVVVGVVCKDKGGEYGEYGKPNEVGHGGDVTPLALASDSREPFL